MQLTAYTDTSAPTALRAPNPVAPAAVVRHVSAGFGHKQVVAFLFDTDLPDGTQLVPVEGVMAWMRGAVEEGDHGYRVVSDHTHSERAWPNNDGITSDEAPRKLSDANSPKEFAEYHLGKPYQAPRKFTDAQLLAIYHAMDSQAILANKEPGSFGDAILAAFAREVLKAAGVPA